MSNKMQRYSLLVIRLLVGLVFLVSAVGKLIDSGYVNYALVRLLSTKFYWLIEYAAALVIAISMVELIIALILLWGKKFQWALSATFLFLMCFSRMLVYI